MVGCVQGFLRYTNLDEHLYGKWVSPTNHKIPHYQVIYDLPHDDVLETYVNEIGVGYTSLRIASLHDIEQAHLDDYLDTQTHPRLVELHQEHSVH